MQRVDSRFSFKNIPPLTDPNRLWKCQISPPEITNIAFKLKRTWLHVTRGEPRSLRLIFSSKFILLIWLFPSSCDVALSFYDKLDVKIEGPPPQSTTLVVLIFEGDRGMDIPQAFQNYTMRHKCAKPKANNCLARLRFNTICGSGSRLRAIASAYKPPTVSSKDKREVQYYLLKLLVVHLKFILLLKF